MMEESQALARRTDPETSHAAAATVDVNTLERKILEKLERTLVAGMTCSELAYHLSTPRDSISPRMKGLVTKGFVKNHDQEKRVPIIPASDRRHPKQLIWIITDAGLKIARVSQSEPV